jgi:hypothetical protein
LIAWWSTNRITILFRNEALMVAILNFQFDTFPPFFSPMPTIVSNINGVAYSKHGNVDSDWEELEIFTLQSVNK